MANVRQRQHRNWIIAIGQNLVVSLAACRQYVVFLQHRW